MKLNIRVPIWANRAAVALWAVATILWLALEFTPHRFERTLPAQAIHAQGGYRYRVAFINPSLSGAVLDLVADDEEHPFRSKLVLYENGRPLGPSHALHTDLQTIGQGRYSHWGHSLIFSSSDNTDPLTNGRTYFARAPLQPAWWLRLAGPLGLLFATLGLVARAFSVWRVWGRIRLVSVRAFDSGFLPASPRWLVALGAAMAVAAALLAYVVMLHGAYTTNVSLAGVFPLSDASGYWTCSNEWLDFRNNQTWCHRRPLYSMLLAGIAMLSGRGLELTLFVQACVVGLSLFLFTREVARWLGPLPALGAALIVGAFAWYCALGVTMSEVFGLSFGLLGGACLLRAGQTRSLKLGALGALLFAIAEIARPGAVFALPLLVLWLAALKPLNWRNAAAGLGAGLGALLIALTLHLGAVALTGGDPFASNANAPQTLYGLSVGGNWTALQRDHPEFNTESSVETRQVYSLAFQNIAAHPEVFLKGLEQNFTLYLNQEWFLFFTARQIRPVLALLGLIFVGCASRRSARARLVLAMALGELATAPFIERDAGFRLWAASGALAQALPLMLVASVVARWLLRWRIGSWQRAHPAKVRGAVPAAAYVAAALGLVMLAPLTYSRAHAPAPSAALCAPGLHALTVNLASAAQFRIEPNGAPRSFPRRVNPEDLAEGLEYPSWFADTVTPLRNVTLIHATPLAPRTVTENAFYAPLSLVLPTDRPVQICVDPSRSLDIAGASFEPIVALHPL